MHATARILPGRVIRPMTAEDLDEVLEIEADSFPNPWTRALFESELENPISTALTLKVRRGRGFSVAGYMVYWIVAGEAHILNIAVKREFRRMGAAAALIEHALDEMRSAIVREVFLEVRRSNTAAIELYLKFGFKESYERRNYYGNEDAIVMTLEL